MFVTKIIKAVAKAFGAKKAKATTTAKALREASATASVTAKPSELTRENDSTVAKGKVLTPESRRQFKFAEDVAHRLAYELTPQTRRVVLDGLHGGTYRVKPIETTHRGLVMYALVSTEPGNNSVHLVARGTDPSSSDCIERNLEGTHAGGAGQASFALNKNHVLRQISKIAKERSDQLGGANINLTISGHSLGGADAQAAASAVLETLAARHRIKSRVAAEAHALVATTTARGKAPLIADESFAGVDLINKIDIYHANAAGVSEETARIAKESLKYLNALPGFGGRKAVDVSLHAIHVNKDAVQMTGEASILADVPPSLAKVGIVRIANNESEPSAIQFAKEVIQRLSTSVYGAALGDNVVSRYLARKTAAIFEAFKAHVDFHFGPDENHTNKSYKVFYNNNRAGRIEVKRALAHKTHLERKAGHRTLAVTVGSRLFNGLRSVLYGLWKAEQPNKLPEVERLAIAQREREEHVDAVRRSPHVDREYPSLAAGRERMMLTCFRQRQRRSSAPSQIIGPDVSRALRETQAVAYPKPRRALSR